jgi:tripartite-type tricarboxylate transporter receptor subunit TctC
MLNSRLPRSRVAAQGCGSGLRRVPHVYRTSMGVFDGLRRVVTAIVIAVMASAHLFATPAVAQEAYPTKVVTMVVPFAAGGPTDVIGRLIASHMSKTLGQQVIVENVGGAGGTIGMTRVAQSKPDGYVIGLGSMGTQAASTALYPGLKYHPATSFDQIGVVNYVPFLIVAKTETPAATLGEFISHVKANPGKISHGHAGVGSATHAATVAFNALFELKPNLVAYRGTAPALNDLVGGQIDYMTDQAINVISQISSGTIKAYAVAAPERLVSLPNVPTTKEAGVDFIFSNWSALVAPKGLPEAVRAKLVASLDKALADPLTAKRYVDLGSTVPDLDARGPDALQKFVESEIARIAPVLKAAGATLK